MDNIEHSSAMMNGKSLTREQIEDMRSALYQEVVPWPSGKGVEYLGALCDMAMRAADTREQTIEQCIAVVRKHLRHIDISPGAGADLQCYGIATCEDILNDLATLSPTDEMDCSNGWVQVGKRLPAEGTPVLVWIEEWTYPVVASYSADDGWVEDGEFLTEYTPTHWHPIPDLIAR